MLIEHFMPRFCETDALGHINNVSYSAWVEQSRTSLLMNRDVIRFADGFNFVLANVNMDFMAEGYFGQQVSNHSWISELGRSSLSIRTDIFQEQRQLLKARSTLVYFDLQQKKTCPMPDEFRALIENSASYRPD
ncbi:acyl-CoA thioesterase [Pseudoteredinibacter isoporae]|uniref:Acyl-CoA thioester hydrolase n=1 Tax=Pseudoteredinibacter isoporae TaxID=570281 RepID=A0A7X0MYH9_9GAMM|nr:acyl-CoA thioester hydrolase [Pseudoteredinibacter isoporae]NHO88619.1 acyl-CoA thioesterase [Pseudoteredinibacter isoporae]NIB22690.1 acyl-CoA thioesterase [Pseudoteredinibacter isoporae]